MSKSEVWRSVEGLDGYLVSDRGSVMSLNYRRQGRSEILKQSKSGGYSCVNIRGRLYPVHRLVAMAFVPNPDEKADVLHKNGNTHDNRADNLRWAHHNEWKRKDAKKAGG